MDASATTSPFHSLRVIASDIKLAHSVFALPFALLAAFMAALGPTRGTNFVSSGESPADEWTRHTFLHLDYAAAFWPVFLKQLALIIGAMILARTCAMLANRLIDRRIDALNPRTANRALPSGRLSPARAIVTLAMSAAGFIFLCAAFGVLFDNWWPLMLALPVLIWICAYGYLKRFTALCHLYLGSSLALSPLAAAIAIDPSALRWQLALWLLSAFVLCWVAGFDIIYALQDVAVDRAQKLRSIPARFGERRGLFISRLLHALAALLLIMIAITDERFGLIFGIGVACVCLLLLYEYATVARWGTTRIALAFFTLNGVISLLLGTLGIIDVLR